MNRILHISHSMLYHGLSMLAKALMAVTTSGNVAIPDVTLIEGVDVSKSNLRALERYPFWPWPINATNPRSGHPGQSGPQSSQGWPQACVSAELGV